MEGYHNSGSKSPLKLSKTEAGCIDIEERGQRMIFFAERFLFNDELWPGIKLQTFQRIFQLLVKPNKLLNSGPLGKKLFGLCSSCLMLVEIESLYDGRNYVIVGYPKQDFTEGTKTYAELDSESWKQVKKNGKKIQYKDFMKRMDSFMLRNITSNQDITCKLSRSCMKKDIWIPLELEMFKALNVIS